MTKALHDYNIVVQEFFHFRSEKFLNNIEEKNLINHYWGVEFSKSREQLYLHLLGIIEDTVEEDRIYHRINIILHKQKTK